MEVMERFRVANKLMMEEVDVTLTSKASKPQLCPE